MNMPCFQIIFYIFCEKIDFRNFLETHPPPFLPKAVSIKKVYPMTFSSKQSILVQQVYLFTAHYKNTYLLEKNSNKTAEYPFKK